VAQVEAAVCVITQVKTWDLDQAQLDKDSLEVKVAGTQAVVVEVLHKPDKA
jgi:hypothetical protein